MEQSCTCGRSRPPGSGGIRVLVVDDHQMVRAALTEVLDDEDDLTVVGQCEDGSQVLDTVERLQPDVVLMDLSMPGMNGLAATEGVARCPAGAEGRRPHRSRRRGEAGRRGGRRECAASEERPRGCAPRLSADGRDRMRMLPVLPLRNTDRSRGATRHDGTATSQISDPVESWAGRGVLVTPPLCQGFVLRRESIRVGRLVGIVDMTDLRLTLVPRPAPPADGSTAGTSAARRSCTRARFSHPSSSVRGWSTRG